MKEIFVFGSNLSGYHGAGAAKRAYMYHGAIWNAGEGPQGDSYALPTKGHNITFMSLPNVKKYVERFLEHAREFPEHQFKVTRVGCGLAGFKDSEIAPLFKDAPSNCFFDTAWRPYLEQYDNASDKLDRSKLKNYWGTF